MFCKYWIKMQKSYRHLFLQFFSHFWSSKARFSSLSLYGNEQLGQTKIKNVKINNDKISTQMNSFIWVKHNKHMHIFEHLTAAYVLGRRNMHKSEQACKFKCFLSVDSFWGIFNGALCNGRHDRMGWNALPVPMIHSQLNQWITWAVFSKEESFCACKWEMYVKVHLADVFA